MCLLLMKYFFLLTLLITACSKVPPCDDSFVSSVIQERIDSEVEWRQGYCQCDEVQNFISCVLSSELTADIAIQIALLNNPEIQALFEEIGIANADLIEAGLLSNPVVALEVRYPQDKKLKTNIEYTIATSILELLLIPLNTRLARTELEQTKLMVSNEILNLAFEVRRTFYELIAERKKVHHIQSSVEILKILSDLSSKQIQVGNINQLEFELAKARFLEAELELYMSQAEVTSLTEKLYRLLGLRREVCFILPENFPDNDYYGFDLCALEAIALEERLDLQVARFEIIRLSQMLGLKQWWGYTDLAAGVAVEREPDGATLVGPAVAFKIPIFNYGQAARRRLFAQLRQAQARLDGLEVKVLSEVREAHKLLMGYVMVIYGCKDNLLTVQNEISEFSEELYNIMGLGIDQLLKNKLLELKAEIIYSESLKKYLVARVNLDRALGGYLFKLLFQMECMEDACNE